MQLKRLLLALVVFAPLATCAAQSGTQSTLSELEHRQIARANQEQLATALSMNAKADLEPLEVHVIDVGQADAILIICPDGEHQMLIDSGDNRYKDSGTNFKAYMEANQDTDDPIEVVIATHPHADHIGNMAWLLKNYQVDLYVDNGNVYDSRTYERVEKAFDFDVTDYWSAQDEDVPEIDFCPLEEVSAIVLQPEGFGESHDPNDNSIIVRVVYKNTSFLFVGDCEGEEEELLIEDDDTRALLDCDFLKVGHHCSHTSSSEEFIALVSPSIAAVSCGAKGVSTNGRYKHPRHAQLQLLLDSTDARDGGEPKPEMEAFDTVERKWKSVTLNRKVYVTTAEGDLVFHSDGNAIEKQ